MPLPGDAAVGEPREETGSPDSACGRPDETRASGQVHRPITAFAARTLLGTTARCSLPGLHAFARRAARFGSALPLREVRITRANVAICFPELTGPERRRFVKESLEEATCMVAELGHLWLRPVEEVLARIVEVRGEEHLLQGIEDGRGVVVAGPHLGAWELLGLWMGQRHAITSLYRKPRVRELEEVFSSARRRSGAHLHPADASGVRAVCQALRRGGVVGVLPDQDPGPGGGVFVPFFGVPTNSSLLVPRIASRLRATVLLSFAERLPGGAGYRIHIRRGSEEITGGDPVAGARALSRDVESLVRLAPLQYLWSYKRFRTRPPGCRDLYRTSARPEGR